MLFEKLRPSATPETITKRVLIVGCGRSGTTYVATLIKNLGLDVSHEAMGADGIATWCMAVDCEDSPWGGGRRGIHFETILHQVRHPLKVIPSFTTTGERSWKFIERYIPVSREEPVLLRCAKYWYYWNLEAERTAQWTYRVEELENVFPEFCARLGVAVDYDALRKTSGSINTRKAGGDAGNDNPPRSWSSELLHQWHVYRNKPPVEDTAAYRTSFTWDALEKEAPGWREPIQKLARRYGYNVDENLPAA